MTGGDVLVRMAVEDGEMIYSEGDRAGGMYLVHSGTVELLKRGGDGMFETLRLVGAGQVFGELGLIASRPRSEGARAMGDCTVIAVERDKLNGKLDSADPFIKALFEILARNLLSVMDRKPADDDQAIVDDFANLSEET